MLESLLKELEKKMGFSAIPGTQEKAGFFIIQIPPSEEVWIKELDGGLFLQSRIIILPSKSNYEDFFAYLMRANFLGQGTGGGVIGLDPDEKFLTLSLKIPYEINYKDFRDEVENFVNYVSYWKDETNQKLA